MRLSFWLAAIFVAFIGLASPCSAQATRTWVSGVGDDANPCSRTAPCKTFAGAISKTATGGEINTLDPGGFGALTITKAITVRSDHIEAGVLVSGTNGIVIQAGTTDKVVLEGLDFEGLGTGLDGVKVLQAGTVTIRNCAIRNFTQNGVEFIANANARGFIENTQILGNVGGLSVNAPSGANNVFVENSLIDNNSSYSVRVGGSSAIALNHSALTGGPSAITYIANMGSVITTGTNLLRGMGAPNVSTPLQ